MKNSGGGVAAVLATVLSVFLLELSSQPTKCNAFILQPDRLKVEVHSGRSSSVLHTSASTLNTRTLNTSTRARASNTKLNSSGNPIQDFLTYASSSVSSFDVNSLFQSLTVTPPLSSSSSSLDPSSILPILSSPSILIPLTILSTLYTSFQILSNPQPNFREGAEPYPRGQYNPSIAREYYSKRPLLVLRRASQILRLSNTFIFNLLIDKYIFRNEERNKEQKGQDLLKLIQNIGPTAIKVGQALSVRSDLIPDYYAKALVELQDNVPPFDSKDAVQILKRELGSDILDTVFVGTNFQNPVASASIGQVYKGIAKNIEVEETIVNSEDGSTTTQRVKKDVSVAIKVQRPNVLSEISLDLFIVREFAPIYQKLTGTSTDLQALANEWGRGFIDELTYDLEKRNTIEFNKQMKAKNLNAICAPNVIESLSTDQILVTEWVDGMRLDRSEEEDVARLCGVALNAYLVMLLETGVLHCDPHPGNLLRTKDGKLCILDFGMTLETPPDLQYSLLEFIAHLTAEDYEQVPYDFVKLDFLKEDKVDLLVKTGALEPLYYFLRQANQGGGGTKVRERIFDEYRTKYPGADDDELRQYMRQEIKESREQMAEKASAVTGVTMKVEDLQRENSDAFRIPEWFLYTSRAFLTLEGISLQADPDFSIVKSCFPYVAKRLLGDDSPRSQKALRDLIYGKDDELNTEKISELADGFTQYTTTTKIVSQGKDAGKDVKLNRGIEDKSQNRPNTEATITLAKDSADILLAPKGNLVQSLIVEESATALSAQVKDTLREVLLDNPERIRASLPLGLGNLLPKGPVKQIEPFLKKSQREEKVLILAEKIASMATLPEPPTASQLGNMIRSFDPNDSSSAKAVEQMNPEEIAALWKAIRENAPIYAPQVASFGGKLATSVLGKVSQNIDSVIATTDESDDLADQLVRNSARSISAAAKESANALRPLLTTASKE